MRFLLAVLIVARSCMAAFSCAAASAQTGGNTSQAVTITTNTADLIFVTLDIQSNGSNCAGFTPLSVTDSASNSYTAIDTTGASPNTFDCVADFYIANAAAATSVTGHVNTAAAFSVSVINCSGVATSTPLDGHSTGSFSSGVTFTTSASFGANNDLGLCGAGNYYAPTWAAGTIGGGSATIPAGATAGGGTGGSNVTSEFATMTGSNTGSIGITASNISGSIVCAAFLPSGGGGGPTPAGAKSKKLLKLDASNMPSVCAGMATPSISDCDGFTSGTMVSFACLYADGSCGAATIPVNLLGGLFGSNPQALTASGVVNMDQHTCLVGANLGAAALGMGSLGSIDPSSFAYSCTP